MKNILLIMMLLSTTVFGASTGWKNGELANISLVAPISFDGADFVGPTSGPTGALIIGSSAPSMTGLYNTILGVEAGDEITSAQGSTFIGTFAGTKLQSGNFNTAVGRSAFTSSITGATENTAIGYASFLALLTGGQNVGLGVNSGRGIESGSRNISIGVNSMWLAGIAVSDTIAIGDRAGERVSGSGNILIGRNAGSDAGMSGSNNIYIASNITLNAVMGTSAGASSELVMGSPQAPLLAGYFGEGATSITPGSFSFNGTQGSGADVNAGAFFDFNGGQGTSLGTGSHIRFQTAPPVGPSGSVVNPLVTRMEIEDDGKIDFFNNVLWNVNVTNGGPNTFKFKNGYDSRILALEHQTAGTGGLELRSKDADNTDQINFVITTLDSGANDERIVFAANSANYRWLGQQSGTGVLKPLIMDMSGASAQLILNVDGSLEFDGRDFLGLSGTSQSISLGGGIVYSGNNHAFFGHRAGQVVSSGSSNTFIGALAGQNVTTTSNSVAVGTSALSGGTGGNNTAIGQGAGSNSGAGAENVYMGQNMGRLHTGNENIGIGSNVATNVDSFTTLSSSNEMVIGNRQAPILNSYWGEGGKSDTPQSFSFNGTQGSGADVNAGAFFDFNGGQGTSLGTGSHIRFRTAPPVGPSGSVLNPLVTRMEIHDDGLIDLDGTRMRGKDSGPAGSIVMGNNLTNLTGTNNTIYGEQAGSLLTSDINNVAVGYLAFAAGTGDRNVAVGNAAGTQADLLTESVLVGNSAGTFPTAIINSVGIGANALRCQSGDGCSWLDSISIGHSAALQNGAIVDSVAIGSHSTFTNTTTVTGEFVIGSETEPIINYYFGEGGRSSTPTSDVTLQPTGARGGADTDKSATNDMRIAGAKGTGTGAGSHILFQTALAGLTGSALNPLVTRMEIPDVGAINIDGVYFVGETSGPSGSIFIGNTPPSFTGGSNTVLGMDAGGSLTSGTFNTFMGKSAGNAMLAGLYNTAIGERALRDMSGSSNVTVVGAQAFRELLTGSHDTGIGYGAAFDVLTSSTGVYIGSFVGASSDSNILSTLIGYRAANGNAAQEASFIRSILIGSYAGRPATGPTGTITDSIALGSGTGVAAGSSFVTGSNEMIIGSRTSIISNVYIGEGGVSTTPSAVTIQGTAGLGADVAGGDVNYAAGAGTSLGAGGHIRFQTAPAVGPSGSVINPLVTRMEIPDVGAIDIDGIDFVGPTSGPANSIVIGNNPVGITGAQNTILGVDAGVAMTSSSNSVLIGWRAGQSTTTNSDNVYVGMDAALLWTGSANVVIGANVDGGANSGTKNFVGGSQAALAATAMGSSVMVGQAAGSSFGVTTNSICIGQDSCDTATGGNFHIGIGSGRPTSATAPSEMYVGGSFAHIDSLYLGEGGRSASIVGDFAISNSLTTGTDIAGPDLNIIGGRGTGDGAPGVVTINAGVMVGAGTADQTFVEVASFSDGLTSFTGDVDVTGNVDLTGGLFIDGVQVVSNRVTGYTDPTGTTDRLTFDTTTVTTENLAEFVKALYEDMQAHGLIGN